MGDFPEEEKEPWPKKVLVMVIGIFLLILITSYTIVSYPAGDYLVSRSESAQLIENRINLESFSIVFDDNTLGKLKSFYFKEQKREFSVCLQGEKIKNNYYINNLYMPKTFRQTFNHVSFEPCKDSLITLHTHPYRSCTASAADINTLRKSQENNPDVLMIVMCEPGRFSVYS